MESTQLSNYESVLAQLAEARAEIDRLRKKYEPSEDDTLSIRNKLENLVSLAMTAQAEMGGRDKDYYRYAKEDVDNAVNELESHFNNSVAVYPEDSIRPEPESASLREAVDDAESLLEKLTVKNTKCPECKARDESE